MGAAALSYRPRAQGPSLSPRLRHGGGIDPGVALAQFRGQARGEVAKRAPGCADLVEEGLDPLYGPAGQSRSSGISPKTQASRMMLPVGVMPPMSSLLRPW